MRQVPITSLGIGDQFRDSEGGAAYTITEIDCFGYAKLDGSRYSERLYSDRTMVWVDR